MKTNAGPIDRIARATLGVLLLGLAYTGTIGAWGWLGVIPLATAALGFCPLYTALGINTCPVNKS